MSHHTLRRVMLSFAGVIVAVSALTLLGCSGGSGDPNDSAGVHAVINQDTRDATVFGTIPLDAQAAANGITEIVEGCTFEVPGAAFAQAAAAAAALQNEDVLLTFLRIDGVLGGTFSLTAPNLPPPGATGTVTFGTCTFTVASTTNPAVLPVGTVITIANCAVDIFATGVPVGTGGTAAGTMTLVLNNFASEPLPTTVQILGNGVLLVKNCNGVFVATVIVTITGSAGTSPL